MAALLSVSAPRDLASDGIGDETPWRELTRNPEKRRLYASDSWFLEGQAMLEDLVGPGWVERLHGTAMILFKPEAVAGRRLARALDYLESHRLRVTSFATPIVDAALTHQLWRYQLNFATVDRILLQTRLRPPTRTLAVLLRGASDDPRPLTIRLKALKGAAVPEVRSAGTLRDALGSTTALLNFVHAPDEPADLVRELAIFAHGSAAALDIARDAAAPRGDLERAISELYEEAPAHDLDCAAARARARARVLEMAGGQAAAAQLAAAAPGQPLSLRALLRALATADPGWSGWPSSHRWDLAVGAADAIVRDRTDVAALLNDSQTGSWDSGGTA